MVVDTATLDKETNTKNSQLSIEKPFSFANIQTYTALALQMRCTVINLCDVSRARQQMSKTIDRLNEFTFSSSSFIKNFSGTQTRLLVLPEYFLTGFPVNESITQWAEKAALDVDGAEYQALGLIAQDNKLFLSGNVYERDHHFPNLYFQTSFIIDPSGDVILRYRRLISMYTPTPHDVLSRYLDIYGQDALFPVVDTAIGRLACIASEEILYPEIARVLALKGAEVICHSSSELSSALVTPKNIAKLARAYENSLYIVSANSAGVSGFTFPEFSTDGSSQVVDCHGRILAQAGSGESMSANAEIDILAVREMRRRPCMTNMLARQKLDLFVDFYNNHEGYPSNTMIDDVVPERSHFSRVLRDSIQQLVKNGII